MHRTWGHPENVKFANAYALILGHNLPSGNTTSSIADKQVTSTLINASKLFENQILDHIIIGSSGT